MTELPLSARIREVGPRDGFQNEPEVIPTETKVKLINGLARTGLRRLELTSFVRPDVVPQLADAAEVLQAVEIPDTVSRSVLIPNERGLERALDDLAEQAGLSRAAFVRKFTASVGEPPHSYLTRWRMGIAAQLLEATDLRLGEIASRVGYRSEFSFSRAFKVARGVSPIQYRRAMPAR